MYCSFDWVSLVVLFLLCTLDYRMLPECTAIEIPSIPRALIKWLDLTELELRRPTTMSANAQDDSIRVLARSCSGFNLCHELSYVMWSIRHTFLHGIIKGTKFALITTVWSSYNPEDRKTQGECFSVMRP